MVYQKRFKEIFGDLGIRFVEAHKFCGGYVGKTEKVREPMAEKVNKWVEAVEDLSGAAVKYPQDAYIAFVKSLQCE